MPSFLWFGWKTQSILLCSTPKSSLSLSWNIQWSREKSYINGHCRRLRNRRLTWRLGIGRGENKDKVKLRWHPVLLLYQRPICKFHFFPNYNFESLKNFKFRMVIVFHLLWSLKTLSDALLKWVQTTAPATCVTNSHLWLWVHSARKSISSLRWNRR